MKKFGRSKILGLIAIIVVILVSISSYGESDNDGSKLQGSVDIDGSSTVYPITEAIAEEFQIENPKTKVTVGMSGTGGGFKRFAKGEIDISNASRELKDEEIENLKNAKINYTKLDIAYDGVVIMVSKENKFAKNITTEELKKIWEPNSKVKKWSDIRKEWPNKKINLYGPGTDSGTFDYFTEEIMGESGAIRTDFTASEDDNVLIRGVSSDKYALGYLGYAYYVENKEILNILKLDGVEASKKTIQSGEYKPLSRSIFIYIDNNSYKEKQQVKEFVDMYMDIAEIIVPDVGYIPLNSEEYKANKEILKNIK